MKNFSPMHCYNGMLDYLPRGIDITDLTGENVPIPAVRLCIPRYSTGGSRNFSKEGLKILKFGEVCILVSLGYKRGGSPPPPPPNNRFNLQAFLEQ
jgi:hypothetical protein